MAGGKGQASRRAPEQIISMGEELGLGGSRIDELVYSSRMSAKVDTAALQDGHQLYHHVLFFTEKGNWTVVQQGLNDSSGYARRYHWSGREVEKFVEANGQVILGQNVEVALDMTAPASSPIRDISVDLVNDGVQHLDKDIAKPKHPDQSVLDGFGNAGTPCLTMPRTINWAALKRAYDIQPKNYEEFVSLPGIGPATVRALALVSELVYGNDASWKDPVKYSFTVGGKDGVPYPVDRKTMDRTVEVLAAGVAEAKLGRKQQLDALKRLRRFVPPDVVI